MSKGTDALKEAFRDYVITGNPATGANEPDKPEIRGALDALAVDIAAASVDDPDAIEDLMQPFVDAAEEARDEAVAAKDATLANLASVSPISTGRGHLPTTVAADMFPTAIGGNIGGGVLTASSDSVITRYGGVNEVTQANAVGTSNFPVKFPRRVRPNEWIAASVLVRTATAGTWPTPSNGRFRVIGYEAGTTNQTEYRWQESTNPDSKYIEIDSTHRVYIWIIKNGTTVDFDRITINVGAQASQTFYYSHFQAGISDTKPGGINWENLDYTDQFMQNSNIAALQGTVSAQALTITSLQSSINGLGNGLDEATDATSPLFVDPYPYLKSITTPGGSSVQPADVEDVVITRISDTQFSVPTGKGLKFLAMGAVAVENGNGGPVTSCTVKNVSSDTITVFETLPANASKAGMIHGDSLHLGRLGYRGLAYWLSQKTIKTAYRKETLFEYNGALCTTPVWSDSNIYDTATGTKIITVTALGGASPGGTVPGTTALNKLLGQESADHNPGTAAPADFTSRSYAMNQNGIGMGYSIPINAQRRDGFIEVDIACRPVTYIDSADSQTKITSGRIRVEVISGSTSFLDETLSPGATKRLTANISGAESLTLRITCLDAVPTSSYLHGVYFYPKSPKTSTGLIWADGDSVAFQGDSWTQYPPAVSGESPPLRPDGSTGDGMQYLSEYLRTILASQGVNITTLNMGKSGTTSAWGRHWIDSVIALNPTKCVLNFAINDANSIATSGGTTDTGYDFDPSNQWAFKVQSAGGLKGSVSAQQWLDNMDYMSKRLIAAGIKPIIIMPPLVASAVTTQTIRNALRVKMLRGFQDITT